jgi:hypothetical protein
MSGELTGFPDEQYKLEYWREAVSHILRHEGGVATTPRKVLSCPLFSSVILNLRHSVLVWFFNLLHSFRV